MHIIIHLKSEELACFFLSRSIASYCCLVMVTVKTVSFCSLKIYLLLNEISSAGEASEGKIPFYIGLIYSRLSGYASVDCLTLRVLLEERNFDSLLNLLLDAFVFSFRAIFLFETPILLCLRGLTDILLDLAVLFSLSFSLFLVTIFQGTSL